MNKKIIAAAIAASFVAAPAMAEPTVYGKIHNSVDFLDGDTGTDATDMADRGSRLGIKGSEDLGNGLKAIYQMEFMVDTADTGFANSRNTFVGLAGDFGTFVMGHHDTPYKLATGKMDIMADQIGDFNSLAGINHVHAADAIAYISPSFSGLTLMAAIVPGNNLAAAASDRDDLATGISLAGVYSNAGLTVIAGWEDLDDSVAAGSENNKWSLGAKYAMDAFTFGVLYEDHEAGVSGGAGDIEALYIPVTYTMGNNVLKVAYGSQDVNGGSDIDAWAIGVDHKMSKRTMAYVQYADADMGGALNEQAATTATTSDINGFSIGLAHSF